VYNGTVVLYARMRISLEFLKMPGFSLEIEMMMSEGPS
jgi:hypothetical protein